MKRLSLYLEYPKRRGTKRFPNLDRVWPDFYICERNVRELAARKESESNDRAGAQGATRAARQLFSGLSRDVKHVFNFAAERISGYNDDDNNVYEGSVGSPFRSLGSWKLLECFTCPALPYVVYVKVTLCTLFGITRWSCYAYGERRPALIQMLRNHINRLRKLGSREKRVVYLR